MIKVSCNQLTIFKFIARTCRVFTYGWTFNVKGCGVFSLIDIFHIRRTTFQYQNQWNDYPTSILCNGLKWPQISPICYHCALKLCRFCIFIVDLGCRCDSSFGEGWIRRHVWRCSSSLLFQKVPFFIICLRHEGFHLNLQKRRKQKTKTIYQKFKLSKRFQKILKSLYASLERNCLFASHESICLRFYCFYEICRG